MISLLRLVFPQTQILTCYLLHTATVTVFFFPHNIIIISLRCPVVRIWWNYSCKTYLPAPVIGTEENNIDLTFRNFWGFGFATYFSKYFFCMSYTRFFTEWISSVRQYYQPNSQQESTLKITIGQAVTWTSVPISLNIQKIVSWQVQHRTYKETCTLLEQLLKATSRQRGRK